MFSLLLPSRPKRRLTLPAIAHLPPANGRKLPNAMVIVEDPKSSDALYKFVPWARSQLAWNEIDIYTKLDGVPGVTPLLGVAGNRDYLVRKMRRSHHGSLSAFLFNTCKGDPALMRPELVCSLLANIVRTMMNLHALDIVHRDLKAENILVFDDAADINNWRSVQPKVSDFDRALELPPGQWLETPVGSLFHMAPELLAWERHDRKVDVYAFGIVMFEVAHGGRVPYYNISTGLPGSLTSTEFSAKVVNEGLRPDWSYDDPALKQLAGECWAKNPDQRPEFAEIFDRIARHTSSNREYVARERKRYMDADISCARSTMEDALCILKTQDALITGIFDGLRDARSSEWAARQSALILASELDNPEVDVKAAICTVLSQVDTTLQQLEPGIESGTTATIAVLSERDLVLAWLGDSPAWLFRREGDAGYRVLELVNPHHPDRPDETARITACGARVGREQRWMDNGEQMPVGPVRVFVSESKPSGVALSRALGLFSMRPAISQEPEFIQIARQQDDVYLVLGSDGVFDLLDHASVFDLVSSTGSAAQAADALIAEVLRRGAPDNASVVVVDMQQVQFTPTARTTHPVQVPD